jgi:hypothetical protein
MLREVKNASFERRWSLLGRRYALVEGGRAASVTWSARVRRALDAAQRAAPVAFMARGRVTYWLFEDRMWTEDEGLGAADVLALVRERERRKRRSLERAHAALAADAPAASPRREAIPRAVRRVVFERDGGRCVDCGDRFDLQYDHVIPLALGGSSAATNLQVLCGECNRRKGAALA